MSATTQVLFVVAYLVGFVGVQVLAELQYRKARRKADEDFQRRMAKIDADHEARMREIRDRFSGERRKPELPS